ncbi:TRAP transporter substrate-binding protein [Mangrovicoccus algicola]|uniref:TRAP transporter substrate-binding protein n=1 Tax=Mangrovicoccus algicola TaxID=2771008 RepID=A0A8J6YY78_9RHOB|nr:TRAP transporter substrate-binding protein [Mangrovicoccus algicola]MBE3639967.1 TRAP transporter substrate-binding protein [Mangrovicoccus algicola]
MKTATLSGLALATALLLGSTALADTTIRFAHHLPTTSEQHVAAERFAALVEDRSGGSLHVEVLPAGQMGGQREIIESVQLGTLDMGYGESGLYANYVPAFGILTLPYLYDSPEHWRRVVLGETGTGLGAELESATGLVVMNWIEAGYRDTYTTDREIAAPEDFKGMKIRVPESPVFVETFAALGAEPTPIPSPEIYTAMQTGVVAAMEGTPEVGYIQRIYEVATHLNKTRHIFFDGSFVTSRMFLDSLGDEEQAIVLEAAAEVAEQQRNERAGREEEWFAKLGAEGLEIHEVDPAPFREALAPLQDSFAAKAAAEDLLAAIRDAGDD